jgi:hypothetical protein
MRRTVLLGLALALLAAAAPAAALPPVKHVFVIVLENKNFEASFGQDSPSPYLAHELTARGKLLTQYHATSHASLGNYISMISGQAANPLTQADCPAGFVDIFPGLITPDGQVLGLGCVYPPQVKTVADQLDVPGLTWKAYMQDMGTPCRHPEIGAIDDTQSARIDDQYAVRHDPFVYFHSIIDSTKCERSVVDLRELTEDLKAPETTPAFSFISPNLCEDGHDAPCVDGQPGGLRSIDGFLRTWVPRILDAPAMADGMLIVTFDEAGDDDSACCGEPTGPSTPSPGIGGPGGGRTGAVVVSPWTQPGTTSDTPYNHYSLLRSIEDLFGLDHLGYAGQAGLRAFGDDVYDTAPPVCSELVRVRKGVLTVRSQTRGTLRVRLRGKVRTHALEACSALRVRLARLGQHGRARVSFAGTRRTVRY